MGSWTGQQKVGHTTADDSTQAGPGDYYGPPAAQRLFTCWARVSVGSRDWEVAVQQFSASGEPRHLGPDTLKSITAVADSSLYYQYWSIHIAWISRWMYWMGFAAAGHQCERHESERDKATRLQEPSTSNCPPSRARHCHGRRWNPPQERLKRLPRMNNLARDWPAVIHREDVFPFSLLPPASPSPTGITGNTQPGPYQSNHRGPMPKAHSRLHQQSRFTTLPSRSQEIPSSPRDPYSPDPISAAAHVRTVARLTPSAFSRTASLPRVICSSPVARIHVATLPGPLGLSLAIPSSQCPVSSAQAQQPSPVPAGKTPSETWREGEDRAGRLREDDEG
ncbi:hypothetical protein M430DRAFT_42142 [Amorphotheca resinae ATCC 22711]|uniref:Uncharacterized protein n=1 Tax=Amorphotheca resinae ATCC 22711 TaxID=857342 RepID=A0A2T3B1Q3_AMORE|nr:hypothetical protein M430DRAFT_42142 [Amorphotheca resinae ATCC 22711]PSS18469.1 hypothetical protein M430DRAFT_42142 [Amorphotheca resinae ATCC 22711]